MDECIFCKIIKGEIPCTKIFEDDKILAFLDIAPTNKGHTLIIPKEHYENLLDIPDDLLAAVAKTAKKLGKAVQQGVNADGFNIGQNNGKAAGQIVMHFHLHIIPRFDNDGLIPWPQKSYEEGEAEKVAEKIVKFL